MAIGNVETLHEDMGTARMNKTSLVYLVFDKQAEAKARTISREKLKYHSVSQYEIWNSCKSVFQNSRAEEQQE